MKDELLQRKLQWLLNKLSDDTKDFLEENPELTFYSVGLDCNSEYGTVMLCFNTEDEFQKSLAHYRQGKYADMYQTPEDILDLRFNTGDWEYQDVASYEVFSEQELQLMFGDDLESQIECMMDFNYQVLKAFTKSPIYQQIPKTKDFQPICIDHEDDVLEALERSKEELQNT